MAAGGLAVMTAFATATAIEHAVLDDVGGISEVGGGFFDFRSNAGGPSKCRSSWLGRRRFWRCWAGAWRPIRPDRARRSWSTSIGLVLPALRRRSVKHLCRRCRRSSRRRPGVPTKIEDTSVSRMPTTRLGVARQQQLDRLVQNVPGRRGNGGRRLQQHDSRQ